MHAAIEYSLLSMCIMRLVGSLVLNHSSKDV